MKIPMTTLTQSHASPHTSLKQVAVELEATFLAEMLKSAGLGKASESFGGGVGEDQFASLLVQHQARQLAQSGGIGLSEVLFDAMKERHDVE